jgi:hypothetical protein
VRKFRFQLTQNRKFHLYLTLTAITVSIASTTIFLIQPLLSQATYFGYMPAVKSRIIAETEATPCRWAHTTGSTTNIYYKWGSNLQVPGTTYRNAYETSVVDWNAVAIKLRFSYSNSGSITFNSFNAPGGAPGQATPSCSGTFTVGYLVELNTANPASPGNPLRALAGHEVGHSLSIGHIPGRDFISLMGYNPDVNVYYTPQQSDIDFVNQYYQ